MPKLPAADRAIIDASKVRDYLLSASHPIGRFKAAFFRRLGYSESDWPRLQADLKSLAQTNDAIPGQSSAHGLKFEVRGALLGPAGKKAHVVSVWIVAKGEDAPRLITVYPGGIR